MIFIPKRGGTEYDVVMSPVHFGFFIYITSVESLEVKCQPLEFSDLVCHMHSAYSAP